ncbi:MAG TPA: alpha/beta fold hydrolase [Acidimicrobiales bacterium]|nr:alpha/beta fold hydrolase [Acidimicrobiales bacterium]
MSRVPLTRYARSGEVHVAYQVLGSGPADLVFVPGAASHLETLWEHPAVARWFRRLAWMSRLITFDKRGTGMSDRVVGVPTLEERMDDVRAVMDAVGSERAVVAGASEGGAIAVLFAATYPDRVSGVIAIGSGAFGWRPDPESQRRIDEYIAQNWGTGLSAGMMAPSAADDETVRAWFGAWERRAASPGAAVALLRMNAAFDISAALSSVSAPTLVIHRQGDLTYRLEQGRQLAEGIPGARFVELTGTDHAPWFQDPDSILDLVEEFVAAERTVGEPERQLATLLFADLDLSVKAPSGDPRVREEKLQHYEALARGQIDEQGGRLMRRSELGMLASFDGPVRAVHCAVALAETAEELGVDLRVGLHSGEVWLRSDDITGPAVSAVQLVAEMAPPGGVVITDPVRDLIVGSDVEVLPLDTPDMPRTGTPCLGSLFTASRRTGVGPLSRREAEVVGLVAAGLDNAAIAETLSVSRRTVDAHLVHIRDKLGLSSRVDLARWGIEQHLAHLGAPSSSRYEPTGRSR